MTTRVSDRKVALIVVPWQFQCLDIQTKHTAVQDLALENSVLRTFKPVFKIYFSDEQKYSLHVMPHLLTIGKTSKMSTTGAWVLEIVFLT
ncbi:hypothetical protein DPMN_119577 [Dreissena polymorpha]|uniref:Uncharacterized protein n=1 Tax=Dreissena polymorpha TaxID=45954 RepID=A0A9D4GJI2_DREPO|nr:hypothetical protein DPMN_119577 [Dreissena polymorpha]